MKGEIIMEVKVLNSNAEVVEGKVVITRQTEEHLTMQDLMYSKENIKRQKLQLVEQSKNLKKQYDELDAKDLEIDEMLKMFPDESLETI